MNCLRDTFNIRYTVPYLKSEYLYSVRSFICSKFLLERILCPQLETLLRKLRICFESEKSRFCLSIFVSRSSSNGLVNPSFLIEFLSDGFGSLLRFDAVKIRNRKDKSKMCPLFHFGSYLMSNFFINTDYNTTRYCNKILFKMNTYVGF